MKATEAILPFAAVALLAASRAHAAQAEVEGENVTEARPVLARPMLRGGLSFGGAELYIAAYAPGWSGIPVRTSLTHSGEGPRPFEIRGAQTYFKGTSEWTLQADNTIRGCVEMECVTPVEMQCVAVAVDIPAPPPFGLGDASAATFDLPLSDGRMARLTFPKPVNYHSQDSRQWGGQWTVRFAGHLGHGGTHSFEKGERLLWEMALAAPDGLSIAESKPLDIVANDDWVRLDYRKDIVPGSALDLSGQGLQDAPAGKHGWLKAVGDHFEFENLPGVEQRFYGVNLCFTANYPDHEVADRLVDRFVRFGYNSIRVHHHDGAWAKAYALRANDDGAPRQMTNDDNSVIAAEGGAVTAGKAGSSLRGTAAPVIAVDVVNDDIDRLDYLLAKCFERGIYVTTDLYVSRSVEWREIGIDRDGAMNKQLYKTYVGIHDGAFSNWCHWAQAFLDHVNPYTGRAYKDEPGLPLISLINEGKLSMGWGESGKGRDPVVQEAWKQCRVEMQNAECTMHNDAAGNLSSDANFNAAAGGDLTARSANLSGEAALKATEGGDDTPPSSGANTPDSLHDRFDKWINRRIWERGTAFVRSLGCRALLTNDNNGRWHGEGEGLTPLYDYVDNHFYVDHPTFLEQSWKLPSKCGNANPIKAELPSLLHRGYAKKASKPYAITEWNFSGPGRYRGMGGILTGALAAEQDWDGLWRFAYSHSNGNLVDGKGNPGYFDCVTDPLIAASDRASVCLYLRGDAAQIQTNAQCTMHNAQFGKALRLDKQQGSMTLVSPRTCGGFAESGRIDAGPLSFEIVESQKSNVESLSATNHSSLVTRHSSLSGGHTVPTTLWASSLDGEPLERSSRILLTHLTDVQGEGARYADDQRKILLKWGKTPLIEVGAALVELRFVEREGRAGDAGNDDALRANDDGAPRQMTNDKSNVIAPQAHVIATEGGSSLREDGGRVAPTVFALDTAGNRIAEVPAQLEDGVLRFRVCTAGPEGGRIYYEIVRTTPESRTTPVTPLFGAGLSMPNLTLMPGTALPGWSFKGSAGGLDADTNGWRTFRIRVSKDDAATLQGKAQFAALGGKDGRTALSAKWRITSPLEADLLETYVGSNIPGSLIGGGKAIVDGKEVSIELDGAKPHLFRGAVTNLVFVKANGEELLCAIFDKPTRLLLQDGAHWGADHLTLRIFFAEGPLEAGREYAIDSTIRFGSSDIELAPDGGVTIEAGPDWLPLANEPWIEPGSALDFSQVLPHHAPAGKFGRVVAVGDHFEFEKLPGVAQRFYGVNICGDANVPSTPEAADRFAANLARVGYNTLRIHHHERNLISKNAQWREGLDDTVPDPERLAMFDSLVAACVNHGIYLTTDLFVSRSHLTTWHSLGIDRDGCISNTGDYKVLCAFWEPAFTNLCAWARNFMTHVNPHTGRSLAEEPALATLALINEGNLGNWGAAPLRDLPGVATAWQAWLAAKRSDERRVTSDEKKDADNSSLVTRHSSLIWDEIPDSIPVDLKASGDTPEGRHAAAFAIFLADMETRLADRLRAFVRDELHCSTPLSSLSCWYNPAQYQLPRMHFDYVDDHFYVDHPVFLDKSWSLPSRCNNVNPVAGQSAGAKSVEWRRLMDKPFCLTEWNYSGPGRFRGVGGIATGALGALQNWSGMWRFAWSHGRAGVEKPETKTLTYFDMSGDPLGLAAERAALCLFLRGDLAPLPAEYPLVLEEAALRDPRNGAPACELPGALWAGWHARVGSTVEPARALSAASPLKSPPAAALSRPAGVKSATLTTTPEQVREDLAALGAATCGNGAVSIDSATGTFLLNTPCTAGGFAESGSHAAGPLRFTICETQRTGANDDAANAANDGALRANDDGASRQMTNDKIDVIAPQAHVIAAEGGSSLRDKAARHCDDAQTVAAATVWASSLDGKPIAESSHILLTHLTDVQNSGIRYADPALTILLKWGGLPHLMRCGAARIELTLNARELQAADGGNDNTLRVKDDAANAANDGGAPRQMENTSLPPQAATSFAAQRRPSLSAQPTSSLPLGERPVIDGGGHAATVYRLSPSGRRLGEVPCAITPSAGSGPQGDYTLTFTARTDLDPSTATYLYEIVRE